MSDAIVRLSRCADATEQFASLTRDECVPLLALWTAACLTVRDLAPDVKRDAEVAPCLVALRDAVRSLS